MIFYCGFLLNLHAPLSMNRNSFHVLKFTRFYSGVVAGAREALLCGVPSLSISLNWYADYYYLYPVWIVFSFWRLWISTISRCRKKDESQETDFKDAVVLCLPLIIAAIRDVVNGTFLKNCFLNIEIPKSPLTSKVYKFNCNLDNNIEHFTSIWESSRFGLYIVQNLIWMSHEIFGW